MKKITLLLLMVFYSLVGYSQFFDFEGLPYPNGLPVGWIKADNGVGLNQSWRLTNQPPPYVIGTQAMFIDREEIGMGNTSRDYLITSQITVPTNGQIRFFAHQTIQGDNGTIYELRYSTNPNQSDLSQYQLLKSWTEPEMNTVFNVFEEKVVSLVPALTAGQQVYLAFVRVFTQPTAALSGDRWIIDNINITPKCFEPNNLGANPIASTTAKLIWDHTGTAVNYQIQLVDANASQPANNAFTDQTNNGTPSFLASNLTPDAGYKFWVRAECSTGVFSDWVGPFYFNTIPFGTVCNDPIIVTPLPYETDDNTANYTAGVAGPQGTGCGATPATTNYLSGNDVYYSYTAEQTGLISVTLTPNGTRSSVFIYSSCASVGNQCLAGVANTNGNPRVIDDFAVTQGTTYIIVISSNSATQTVGYNLIIQYEECDKPTNLGFNTPTLNGGTLTWTEAAGATAWQVAVQDAGAPIPSGNGQYNDTDGVAGITISDLDPAHLYQYWVRSECSPGVYSAWSGPFVFNTLICAPADQCTYTFRMTDSANNGWNGARMQVRQNGIILTNSTTQPTTIGGTYNSGAGPVDITYTVCDGVPFDIFWLEAGTQPQQCIVSVINSFGQTIFTKPAGVGMAGQVVYTGIVDCDTPRCDIAPTNVTSTVTTIGATVTWTSPGTENMAYEIYVVPAGSPAPDALSTPTATGVHGPTGPTFSHVIPNGLTADTPYDVYVRIVCVPNNSPWSVKHTFTTLPTCPKPTNQAVLATSITTTSAQLSWTEGGVATEWEVLLLASGPQGQAPAAPGVVPVVQAKDRYYPNLTTGTSLTPTDLEAATIYYYYVRAVCGGNDPSTWTGPFIFNTITCAPEDKCQYKFLLTDTGGNGWNGARMQVRQNGIVVATLGANFNSGSGPITVNVMICNDAPFDLYWSVAGTAPQEVGVSVQNPFTDIVYTYIAGSAQPLSIIYADDVLGNCVPPTCPKPTNLLVNVANTTQTTAELSWTESGTAQQWEVYVMPVGSAAPVNYTPLNTGVPGYYLTGINENPYTVTGLTAGTAYIYYVRAICSPTDISTWTILNPKIFYTKPVNDECSAAIPVPVNPTRVCTDFVSGNTLGGTLSTQGTTCTGGKDDDIWYSFVATSTIHIITFSNVTGTSTDINHVLYLGDECGTLTQVYCSDPNISIANNLTVGATYKIRVFTKGTSPASGINPLNAAFDLCITTPPPITNDECATAIVAPVNEDIPCVVFTQGSITGATASPEPSTCAGTEDDDVWFEFTANSPTQIITLANVVGSLDNDLNHSLYQGDQCGNLTFKYCSTADESMAQNLTVGAVYKIRVWSASSAVQDITFDLCIGRILPPIVVNTTTYTKEELVKDILIKSECATVTNVTYSTGNTVATNGIGYFNKDQSGFPFQDGIVLTTGSAMAAPGPNTSLLSNGGLGGDADLSAILAAQTPPMTGTLYNATSLEFDFVALTDEINFNFLFASEEYGTFQCGYSDAFAFILKDITAGTPAKNLAVIPNTNIPVSVTNIRNQMFNGNCSSANSQYFDKYYGNVAGGVNPIGANINFNGVTVPLTATSAVVPGNTYHIKMVIADYNDGSYDSAVFLEGGSFDIGNIELPDDFLVADGTAICVGDVVVLDSGLNTTFYEIKWLKGTDEIPGATGPVLTVTDEGTYTIQAKYIGTDCVTEDSVLVEYFIDAEAVTPQDLVLCDASGSGNFDLEVTRPIILAPFAAGTHEAIYYLTLEDAQDNELANQIPANQMEEFPGVNGQTIYVRINYLGTSCFQIINFKLIVQDLTPQFSLLGTKEICPEGATTITVAPLNNSFIPTAVTYTWTFGPDTLAATGPSLNINGQAGYGIYTVTVNNSGCTSTQTFEIKNANTTWFFDLAAPATLCPDETATLSVNITNNPSGLPATYTYTLPNGTDVVSTNNTLTIDTDGTYSVMVNIQGCISGPQTVTVGQSVANWQIAFTDDSYVICPGQATEIAFTATNFDLNNPNAVYTWTAPNGTETQGATVSANQVGTYTLEVDIFGCVSTFPVVVTENTAAIDISFLQGCESNQYRLVAVPENGSFDPLTSTYVWSGPNFVSTSEPNAVILKSEGTYSVTVTTADGCQFTEPITVSSVSCMIQRGISPNNNGENDNFDLSMLNVKELNIFNRYGREVYNYSNYVDQWYGQSNSGDELPDGTYFYVIHTQEGENITGWIYINR